MSFWRSALLDENGKPSSARISAFATLFMLVLASFAGVILAVYGSEKAVEFCKFLTMTFAGSSAVSTGVGQLKSAAVGRKKEAK